MNPQKENVDRKVVNAFPRVLLGMSIDLTYRCNHNCLHCWLWRPKDDPSSADELTVDEILRIADEARTLGARDWTISGGEPMLRPDFFDIAEYLTRKSRYYTIKTNGTLITPRIAQLLARPGETWVSLYGATPEVYERVTRSPEGYERMLRGITLLKEAGARVVIQAFPMRENWHQWPQMVELARSLSRHWRVGAAWLNLSADRDPDRNAMIAAQRLDPGIVVELDPPAMTGSAPEKADCASLKGTDDRLLASCIATRREVHVDPFGRLSICGSVKDPALRYDLRRGTVQGAWEEFIPSLVDKIRGGASFREKCGNCELRSDCRWCPTYAYLENGDHASKVEYLCSVARTFHRFKDDWGVRHRRFYQTGGISLQVDSDLPFTETTCRPAVDAFRVKAPESDLIQIRHVHTLEDLNLDTLGAESFSQGPWTVYRRESSWIYKCHVEGRVFAVGEFSADHRRGTIYHENGKTWVRGGLNTLSLPVTDQILLARLLAERDGCILHSAGVILDNRGFLFIGHSEAGKTTVTRLLENEAEILCDDRNILRRQPDGYRLYGTWSHGESPRVSPRDAPLRAALFLKQSPENCLRRLDDRRDIFQRFMACLIRGFVDAAWWERMLDFAESFSREVPCYELNFTRDAELPALLQELTP